MNIIKGAIILVTGMSQNKIRQMEAEAAERVRVEREGLVVLRLRMADLFAKRDIITTKMDGPIDNLRGTVHVYINYLYNTHLTYNVHM